MESLLKLFRAVLITYKELFGKPLPGYLLKSMIKNGFIVNDCVVSNFTTKELEKLISKIEKTVGLNGKQLNQTFHKEWMKVKTASIEQLVIEQIFHYITTYGYEELGIYNKESVYIPDEVLKVPNIKLDRLNLIVIKGYTKEEFKEKILALLSGIALKEDTIDLILKAVDYLGLELSDELDLIKNKEIKMILHDRLKVVPKNPTEMLRYLIFKSTGKTLLIKNPETITKIKTGNPDDLLPIFNRYESGPGLEKLAEIFFRFKPLFLAFRAYPDLKSTINRIRKLANTYHKPMPEDYLNSVTSRIKNRKGLTELNKELEKVNVFRKIRLAYALKYRTTYNESIMYKIRNGKGFADSFAFDNKAASISALNIVLESIGKDLEQKVKEKKIFIPDNIIYPLPATEKQFTGMLPSGTCVTIPQNVILGVHWNNVGENRIDLDLSMVGMGVKFGWDARYRDHDRTILFSGDITDAPNGATESYYISKQHQGAYIIFLNYYNFNWSYKDETPPPVPFDIFVASEKPGHFANNYTCNPNNVILTTESVIDKLQKTLGILVVNDKQTKFYFSETDIGKSITSSNKEWTEHARKYLLSYHENMIDIKDVLVKAGAKIVTDPEKADIDLSPGQIEKDTFINLLI